MLDLTDVSTDGITVFNNGQAGTAMAKISVEKVEAKDGNDGYYEFVFTDEKGGTASTRLYHLDSSREYYSKQLATRIKVCKNIIEAINPNFNEWKFKDEVALLDATAKMAKAKEGTKVRVLVCYGSKTKPVGVLVPAFAVGTCPSLEPISVKEEDSKLSLSATYHLTEPIKKTDEVQLDPETEDSSEGESDSW